MLNSGEDVMYSIFYSLMALGAAEQHFGVKLLQERGQFCSTTLPDLIMARATKYNATMEKHCSFLTQFVCSARDENQFMPYFNKRVLHSFE